MTTAADVTREALLLPDEARATLAQVLYDSLYEDEDDKELESILSARLQAIQEGRAKFHDPEEIFEVYERMKAERRAAQAS
jgi:hypothetical protein